MYVALAKFCVLLSWRFDVVTLYAVVISSVFDGTSGAFDWEIRISILDFGFRISQ